MTQAHWALAAAFVLVCSAGNVAQAAMAPHFERWAELQAVLADDTVARKLSDHGAVERIEVTPRGVYRFWAGKCYLDATIRRRASQTPGGDTIVGVTLSDVHCL